MLSFRSVHLSWERPVMKARRRLGYTRIPLGSHGKQAGGLGLQAPWLGGNWNLDLHHGQKLCLLGPKRFLVALFCLHLMCFFLSLLLYIRSLVASDRKPTVEWLEKRREFMDPLRGASRCTHNLSALLLPCGLYSHLPPTCGTPSHPAVPTNPGLHLPKSK